MDTLAALMRRVLGGTIDRVLFPILAVTFVGSITGGMLWSFLGIWAIKRLDASNAQLAFGFLGGAFGGAAGGYLGGHLSDRLGRRPLILFGRSIAAIVPLVLLAVGDHLYWGLGMLAAFGFFFSVGGAAEQALVPDLLPKERHEAGYAAQRVIQNLGVVIGPVIGGLLLLGENWNRLFIGVACVAFIPFLLALRYIPKRGRYAPEAPPERGSFGAIMRDPVFLLFFISGTFSTLVYVAYETVMPISLVDSHGISPSTWGFIVVINPLMVVLLQLRITARAANVPASIKLTLAILLMGLPFLALTVTSALPIVAAVIFVFVIGEMLWVPTSQAVVARIAPPDIRGAYIGAFGSTFSIGFALTPFIGLQVRGAAGDATMWVFFASLATVGALIAFIACTRAFGVMGAAEGALEAGAEAEVASTA